MDAKFHDGLFSITSIYCGDLRLTCEIEIDSSQFKWFIKLFSFFQTTRLHESGQVTKTDMVRLNAWQRDGEVGHSMLSKTTS